MRQGEGEEKMENSKKGTAGKWVVCMVVWMASLTLAYYVCERIFFLKALSIPTIEASIVEDEDRASVENLLSLLEATINKPLHLRASGWWEAAKFGTEVVCTSMDSADEAVYRKINIDYAASSSTVKRAAIEALRGRLKKCL